MREEEWENFQPTGTLSPETSGKLWHSIKKNTAPHFSHFSWMAAAASVLLAIGLSWHVISKKPKTGTTTAAAVPTTKTIFNSTSEKMALTLSDASTVELLPNSTLSYPEDFDAQKREVTLDGEATFTIARDAAKPFTVRSRAVTITVLGTRFTVNSYAADNSTKVILHEGKVMVKVSDPTSRDRKNEYYLTPGDIFLSQKISKRPPAPTAKPTPASAAVSTDSLSARILHLEKDKDDGYVFDNYPLDVVFDQLEIIYNTRIIYNRAALGNRTFIGKIDGKDSLYHILKSIVLLNNFGLHKQGDTFEVTSGASPY